jgi:uncharacterized protein YqjF (DUF2071 family)
MQKNFLTAEWRKLILVNYLIDPDKLLPYLPYKTELDLWNDQCYVSLVGFRFVNTRLKGMPVPFHRDFEEINLRFYVRYKDGHTWKRGVTFIKEIVPKPALTFVANSMYNEKYVTLPTRHSWDIQHDALKVSYGWKHQGTWDSIEVSANPVAVDIDAGSEEEFITEHYWGYTPINSLSSSEYQVEHPRWRYYDVSEASLQCDVGGLYGSQFQASMSCTPVSAFLAEGSAIIVHRGLKLRN